MKPAVSMDGEPTGSTLAVLAHELRSPLASIAQAVDLLRTEENADTRNWATTVIARQTTQMKRLIDDLLDVSRIRTGNFPLRKERIDLATVIDGALETVRSVITDHQHELVTNYPHGVLFLEADPLRLEQIIVNLIDNAAKYTPNGGLISLHAERLEHELLIRVFDNGIGIPPEKLATVFELFSRLSKTAERSQGGLGIGLTIVKQLAELHGGSVIARSLGVSLGTEFIVRLPAIGSASQAAPKRCAIQPPNRDARAFSSWTIILIP